MMNLLLVVATISVILTGTIASGCPVPTPRDCRHAYLNGCREDGVYTIDPGCPNQGSFNVFCDMKNGGWTVFLRRRDGSESFYRPWRQYTAGFGSLKGEHWLGLDRIHCLTSAVPITELRVDLADFNGNFRYAQYSFFYVDNSVTNYKLYINGYHGNAGDSISGVHSVNGMEFSTYDRDNDESNANCVRERLGAWWHKSCGHASLNGNYYRGGAISTKGVKWHTFRLDYSLKFAQMKLRPLY